MSEQLSNRLKELKYKYYNLVWAGRCSDHSMIPYIEVERKFSEEIKRLKSSSGDWEHGFNSGALAVLRLLEPYSQKDDWTINIESETGLSQLSKDDLIELAEEEFPMLDT